MDRKERERLAENPLVKGIATGAAFLLTGALLYAQTNSPKKRRDFAGRMRQAAEDETERKRRRDVWLKRRQTVNAYFNSGAGQGLLDEQGTVVIAQGLPFEDAVFENRPAGFRQTSWRVRSSKEGLTLSASYDTADRGGGLSLKHHGETVWGMSLHATDTCLGQYEPNEALDLDRASLAARLLATPGCVFDTIKLVRPDYAEIKKRIWIAHMRANPDLAADIEWDENKPLH